MKSIEKTIEAIEYRLDKLNTVLDVLENQLPENGPYFDYESRIDELETLLSYIKEEK